VQTGRHFTTAALALAVGLAAGCSMASGPTASSQRDRLTAEDLEASNAVTVYDALAQIRPDWLNGRGAVSMTGSGGVNAGDPRVAVPNVYLNGMRMGTVEYLRDVRVQDVEALRYWSAGEASARFGMGNPRGVIEIIPRS
jgi:hypothetical protein